MIIQFPFVLAICVGVAMLAVPVWGNAQQDVPAGGDVFIGEEHLNLTGIPSGTSLSWYDGPQVVGQSAPAATITIQDAEDFYVSPSDFGGRTGTWYIGNTSRAGMIVNDPFQAVSVYDQQTVSDATNMSVPSGDYLTFRVETNMDVIPAQRPGAAGFLTIKVRSPDGTVFTRLWQDNSTQVDLIDLTPDTIPWYWVPLQNGSSEGWSTGVIGPGENRVYQAGSYTFWTECNLNGMQESYKDESGHDFSGKTISFVRNVTISFATVNIVVSNETVVRGKPFSVTITGKPNNAYYVWVGDTGSMSGMAGDQPPGIVLSQDGVRTDPKTGPFPIGSYVPDGSNDTIQENVAQYYGPDDVRGTRYYALVTLSGQGSRTVGFTTTADTKDQKYSIHVERPDPYDPPASDNGPNRTFMSGDADIEIKKGDTTIGVQGPPATIPSYFLGEMITFTGTNSVSDTTYLFITGPNLPKKGGQMLNPRAAVTPIIRDSFASAEVLPDGSWEYKWVTALLDIDPGTYTVYAVNSTSDKGMLGESSSYSTVSFNIRKPFVSAGLSQPTVAAGDPLYIRGIASGQPLEGIAVWTFGTNKILYQTPGVNTDGTFEQEITSGQTRDMAAGQYFVVVQHPMYNEQFDVLPDNPGSPASVLGLYPVSGNELFRVGGPGSLQGTDAANALVQAINNPDIDDIYTKLLFLVEVPEIKIVPVPDHQIGDTFNLSGTTNLEAGDDILVQVVSSSFQPTGKARSGEFSGVSGTVTVVQGIGEMNTWSFMVNTATFKPDSYIVQVSSISPEAGASTIFNVTGSGPLPVTTGRSVREVSGTNVTAGNTTPEEEIAESLPDETPGISDENGENVSGGSPVNIGVRPSALRNATVSVSPTVPTTVQAPITVVTTVVMTSDRTNIPTSRPTTQPGFGGVVADVAGVIGLIIGRSRRE